jgi:hypothetical protein
MNTHLHPLQHFSAPRQLDVQALGAGLLWLLLSLLLLLLLLLLLQCSTRW